MQVELATKEYVDSRIVYIPTYQPFDKRVIRNELFAKAKIIIAFCKHIGNQSIAYALDASLASFGSQLIGNYTLSVTLTSSKAIELSAIPDWYITGFLCIL